MKHKSFEEMDDLELDRELLASSASADRKQKIDRIRTNRRIAREGIGFLFRD